MASKSTRNIIGLLSLSNNVVITVEVHHKDRPRNKTIMALADKLRSACLEARELWPEHDTRDHNEILRRLQAYQSVLPKTGDMEILTSGVLGLLDDVLDKLMDANRKAALQKVHDIMKRIHAYYDRKLDNEEAYRIAEKAIEVWRRSA
jgi:flagellin-specific chaperone FliS